MWASSSAVRSRRDVEVAIELGDEIGEADRVVVEHGDVAGGLVGDVDLVALVDEADQRAAHGDHVVVRVGREDEHALGEDVVVSGASGRPGCLAWAGLPPGQPVIVACSSRKTSMLMS